MPNPIKGLGNFDASNDYIRGKILTENLRRKTKNKQMNCLNESFEEGKIAGVIKRAGHSIVSGTIRKTRRIKDVPQKNQTITIDSNHLITQYQRTRHCLSAIAAVDYALRETKPTCGLATGF